MLNSTIYEVELPDGQVKEYAANVLADNMFSQIDSEGYSTTLLDGIIDFKKDETAVAKADRFLVTKRGRRKNEANHSWLETAGCLERWN